MPILSVTRGRIAAVPPRAFRSNLTLISINGQVRLGEFLFVFFSSTSDLLHWIHEAPYQIYAVKLESGVPIQDVPSALLRWWDAYPSVKSSPPPMTPDDVAALIRDKTKTKSDFAIIDTRRNDHGVSFFCLLSFFFPDMMNPKTFTRAATSVEVISGRPRRFMMTFLRFMRILRM